MTIKNIADVRAWHVEMRNVMINSGLKLMGIQCSAERHRQAIAAIDETKARHHSIAKDLLRRLTDSAAARHRDATASRAAINDLKRELQSVKEQLNAERQLTTSLNDRLAEFEEMDALMGSPDAAGGDELQFVLAVIAEIKRARAKHPGTEAMCNALTEEVGEVAQALADEPYSHVYTECVQVASTAMRVALDGDRAVDALRFRKGLDALPGATVSVSFDMPVPAFDANPITIAEGKKGTAEKPAMGKV